MTDIQHANITVMITDMDRAVAFYTEILGFHLKNRFGNHWADIEAPGLSIGLHPTGRNIQRSDNLQIGLKVADLDRAVSELQNKGVTFHINSEEAAALAFFKDPDNNTLYLVQPKW